MATHSPPPTDNPGPEEGRPTRSRAAARRERLAHREEVRKQQVGTAKRRKVLPWIVLALIVLGAVGWFVWYVAFSPIAQEIPGLERLGAQAQGHVPGDVTYPVIPPVGGDHNPVWQNCGVYAEPIKIEQGVHSLEHGAVWITYRADLPDAQVQTLRGLARGKDYVLVSPWAADPPLPSPIVASAWGLQIKADSASDSRLPDFVRRYANGPQTPERGAVCNRGVGSPLAN